MWISARALPSGPPPPPRYFSLVETEEESEDYYSTENSISKPHPTESIDRTLFWWRSATSRIVPRVLAAAGKLVKRTQGGVGEKGKSERSESPERRLSLQRRSCFREYESTPCPPSRWNSLEATQPTDTTLLTRASQDDRRERTAGGADAHPATTRPSPTPARHLWRKHPLPRLLCPSRRRYSPHPRLACEDGARLWVPSAAAGPLELVTTGGGGD